MDPDHGPGGMCRSILSTVRYGWFANPPQADPPIRRSSTEKTCRSGATLRETAAHPVEGGPAGGDHIGADGSKELDRLSGRTIGASQNGNRGSLPVHFGCRQKGERDYLCSIGPDNSPLTSPISSWPSRRKPPSWRVKSEGWPPPDTRCSLMTR